MTAQASGVASSAGATDPEQSLVFELPGRPTAGAAARRALIAGKGALPSSVRDGVLPLVTALVSNAVRHADAGADRALRVELRQLARTVRVAVFDEGTGFRAEAPHLWPDRSGGWGCSSSTGSPIAGRSRRRRPAPVRGSRSDATNEWAPGDAARRSSPRMAPMAMRPAWRVDVRSPDGEQLVQAQPSENERRRHRRALTPPASGTTCVTKRSTSSMPTTLSRRELRAGRSPIVQAGTAESRCCYG
jgi:hypothetical protein